MEPIRALFLVGQTASGKGAVAALLAARIRAEIISLDSMKVYRGMDIGTAKPPPDQRRELRYHMIDVVDPHEHFSTALYAAGAERAAKDIVSRGLLPLFVGGTALYLKAVVEGIFEGPGADPEFRAKLRREAAELGAARLHERLAKVDPVAAARIHPNDLRRIERALEVYEKTGTPISDLQTQFGRPSRKYDATVTGIRREKADLHERISRRVDAMMARGMLDEVRRLAARPEPLGREAAQALGYKELLEHLRGECTVEEAVERTKLRTRRFAKAQMTWLKSVHGIEWFDVSADEPADVTAGRIAGFLGRVGVTEM